MSAVWPYWEEEQIKGSSLSVGELMCALGLNRERIGARGKPSSSCGLGMVSLNTVLAQFPAGQISPDDDVKRQGRLGRPLPLFQGAVLPIGAPFLIWSGLFLLGLFFQSPGCWQI